jgi:general secretion pathway protein M
MIAQLTPRDRLALIIGAVVVLAALVYVGIVSPYENAMGRLDAQINARQRQLEQVRSLHQEYQRLKGLVAAGNARLDRNKNFSLFSFVENLVTQVATKENLLYMRPQPPDVQDNYKEESVEIKLEKIHLNQLIQMLYRIESADALLQVKHLRVKTRFDDRSLLDVVLTISALGRNK